MAKFRFRLEPVLEQRRREEERAQRVVAALERERMGVEAELRAAHAGLSACKQDLRDALTAPVDGSGAGVATIDLRGVRMQSAASFRLFGDAQRLALRLAGASQRAEAARRELLRATTDRKAVELLREKRREEWKRAIEKREAEATDELAVMRFRRAEPALGAEGAAMGAGGSRRAEDDE